MYDEWYRKGDFEYTKGGVVNPPNYVLQIQWIVDAWTKFYFEIINKSLKTCGITTGDVNKVHCLKEGQPTEEARMLLDESSGNLEFIARPTLNDDVYEIEVENIENVDDLTDKIIEECEIEILSFFYNYSIPDIYSSFQKINAASIQGRLLIIF